MVRIYHINYIFTNLDIKEFHPSLARDLLLVAIIYKNPLLKSVTVKPIFFISNIRIYGLKKE